VKSIYKFVAAQRDSYQSDTIEITEGHEFFLVASVILAVAMAKLI